jgi:hypothetical protein
MKRRLRIALIALLATLGLVLGGPSVTASAQTSGPESFEGFLVATGMSGDRVVLASSIRADGVFKGVGRIIEVPNLPTEPDNVSRDDLVFAEGTLHLVSTFLDFQVNSFDPVSCKLSITIRQLTTFEGGTGLFAGATGTGEGRVDGRGFAQRAPDGNCSLDLLPRHERDQVSGVGTLSF